MMKRVCTAAVYACVLLYCLVGVEGTTTTTVYADSLASPFQDYSWATVNEQYTSVVHGGSAAISFLPNSYNAFYLHASKYISTTTFSGLQLWMYRPANSSTNINFNLIVDGASGAVTTGPTIAVSSVVVGGSWPTNTWVQVSISFSTFPVGTYDGWWLQDGSGLTSNPAVIVDDIVLLNGAASASTSAPATTTSAPATTTSAPASTTTKAPSATTTTTKSAGTTTSTTKSPSTPAATTTTTSTTKAPSTTAAATTTASAANGDPDVLALYQTVTVGQATYYGQYTNGGECMLDPTPASGTTSPVQHTVAIANYLGSRSCGLCLQVTGNGQGSGPAVDAVNGTRVVFVNNECPGCPIGNLDFGLNGDGAWDISYKAVPCPVAGKIQYVFKDGSSPTWIGLQPRNTVHPVYKLAIKINGAWTYLPRLSYNYFVSSLSGVVFPITVQLTSVKGEVVTDVISSIQSSSVIVQGSVQFTP